MKYHDVRHQRGKAARSMVDDPSTRKFCLGEHEVLTNSCIVAEQCAKGVKQTTFPPGQV